MFLINMDETALYFNSPPTRTVHTKGEKTVSVNIQGASLRVTVAVSIAMNRTKLRLFVIFKGKPRGSIEKSLSIICPKEIIAFEQQTACMDDRTMKIWYEKVLKMHLNNFY